MSVDPADVRATLKAAGLRARSPECLAVLRRLESDEDELVRAEATTALANLHQP